MDSSPTMEKKEIVTEKEKDGNPINDDDIMIDTGVIGDDLLFSDDPFPDFPSPSASSTSDFHQKPALPLSSSSSSSPSPWSFLNQAPEPSMQRPMVGPTTAEGSTATHISGNIGLWDPSNPLDSSFFLPDNFDATVQGETASHVEGVGNNNANSKSQDPKPSPNPNPNPSSHDQELSKIFFEWLKSNRDTISLEDLRSIKLKTSTVECAAARLGGGKQGKMQLLKLILAWVQNHHLHKKRRRGDYDDSAHPGQQPYLHYQFAPPIPNPNLGYGCNVAGPWNDDTVNYALALPSMNAPQVPQPSAMCAPHGYYPSTSAGSVVLNSQPFSPSADLHAFSPHPIQSYPPFHGTAGLPLVPQYSGDCSSQYPMHPSSSLAGASSATKEARKKRMARQRRNSTLHRHRILINQNEHSSEKASAARPAQSELAGSSSLALNHNNSGNIPRNWDLWSRQKNSLSAGASPSSSSVTNMHQPLNIVGPLEKRQGLKSEKNLKFLLQKVLKQSDVGSLGRIVLPKKEAETHLPVLDARDGIPILMEDIGISRAWNMRYRYWPNNKSRMYLLENTGDFVRSNGLQEGDFIVIYSDVKHNKYMIRGVKVRQAAEAKGGAARRQNAAKALQKKIGRSDNRVQGSGTFSESNNNSCMGDLPPCGEEDGDTSPSMIMVDDM